MSNTSSKSISTLTHSQFVNHFLVGHPWGTESQFCLWFSNELADSESKQAFADRLKQLIKLKWVESKGKQPVSYNLTKLGVQQSKNDKDVHTISSNGSNSSSSSNSHSNSINRRDRKSNEKSWSDEEYEPVYQFVDDLIHKTRTQALEKQMEAKKKGSPIPTEFKVSPMDVYYEFDGKVSGMCITRAHRVLQMRRFGLRREVTPSFVNGEKKMLAFFYLDVVPAIMPVEIKSNNKPQSQPDAQKEQQQQPQQQPPQLQQSQPSNTKTQTEVKQSQPSNAKTQTEVKQNGPEIVSDKTESVPPKQYSQYMDHEQPNNMYQQIPAPAHVNSIDGGGADNYNNSNDNNVNAVDPFVPSLYWEELANKSGDLKKQLWAAELAQVSTDLGYITLCQGRTTYLTLCTRAILDLFDEQHLEQLKRLCIRVYSGDPTCIGQFAAMFPEIPFRDICISSALMNIKDNLFQ